MCLFDSYCRFCTAAEGGGTATIALYRITLSPVPSCTTPFANKFQFYAALDGVGSYICILIALPPSPLRLPTGTRQLILSYFLAANCTNVVRRRLSTGIYVLSKWTLYHSTISFRLCESSQLRKVPPIYYLCCVWFGPAHTKFLTGGTEIS